MLIVASTLLDLVKNLKSFAGILVVSVSNNQYRNCEHVHVFCSDVRSDISMANIFLSLQVIYYSYALLGMELFYKVIPAPQNNTNTCVYKIV